MIDTAVHLSDAFIAVTETPVLTDGYASEKFLIYKRQVCENANDFRRGTKKAYRLFFCRNRLACWLCDVAH